jgi:protein arginine kinase
MADIPFFKTLSPCLTASGPESATVMSTRVRLARNLQNAPFPDHAKPADLKMILETVISAARELPLYKRGVVFRLSEHPRLDRELLKERHLISHSQAEAEGPRGLVADPDGCLPLMINEEDHLRLAALEPGLNADKAWARLDEMDNLLGQRLAWAYHKEWGFLTACPTNCGTALRVSARLHLPALVLTGRLEPILQGLGRLGLVVRGFYGEGTQSLGDIFQVSNGTTLGRSEREVLEHVTRLLHRLTRHEMTARQDLFSGIRRVATEDLVYRAVALLSAARRISYPETMTLVSRVRMGLHQGLKLPVGLESLQRIMILAQPAHLQRAWGKDYSSETEDERRATLVRKLAAGGWPEA